MKLYKKLALGLLPIAALGWVACSEELYPGTDLVLSSVKDYLVVDKTELNFTNAGGQQTVNIQSSEDWSLNGKLESWLSVDKTSGSGNSSLTFTAAANNTTDSRGRDMLLSIVKSQGERMERAIAVSQEAGNSILKIEGNSSLTFTGKSEAKPVTVTTNYKTLNVSVTPASATWLHPVYNNGILTVTVEACVNADARNATVVLSSTDGSDAVQVGVLQTKSTDINKELNISNQGGTATWTFTAAHDWSITSENPEWLSVSQSSGGPGVQNIVVSALPWHGASQNQGALTLHYINKTNNNGTCIVRQAARHLNVLAQPTTFQYKGGSQFVNISADVDWEVVDKPEWVSLDKNSGTGDDKLKITTTKNEYNIDRTGIVKLRQATAGTITCDIKVTQEAWQTDGQSFNFSWQAQQMGFSVPFNSKWTAKCDAEWVQLSKYSGTGNDVVNIKVGRNDSNDELGREAEIVFTNSGKETKYTVHQEGQYIRVYTINSTFKPAGGELELTVESSVDFTPSVRGSGNDPDASWIEWKKIGEKTYLITAKKTQSRYQRDAEFVLTPNTTDVSEDLIHGVKYELHQVGRSLLLDNSKINISGGGGDSNTINVRGDNDYTIEKQAGMDNSWFEIVREEGNTFKVRVAKAMNKEVRTGAVVLRLLNQPADEDPYEVVIPVQQGVYEGNELYEDIRIPGTELVIRMIRVEGGTFMMGTDDSKALNYAKPAHEETVAHFRISETEVTQEVYEYVMGKNPLVGLNSNVYVNPLKPVSNLTWYEAKEFIIKLNQLTGQTFRLPWENEWEYAARGGIHHDQFKFSGSNVLTEVANTSNMQPVKQKKANTLGIYDMTGNVAEWCEDSWRPSYNPQEKPDDEWAVHRGGYWIANVEDFTVYGRGHYFKYVSTQFVGIRLVISDLF